MNITTDFRHEAWHRLEDPGSYEWWYFDAEDEARGLSVVFIWFSGFAFSPYYLGHYEAWKASLRDDHPQPAHYAGFSFHLYEHGREVVNFIREGRDGMFEAETSGIGVRFEKNVFTYDPATDCYLLTIDFSFPAKQMKVSGSFVFRPQHRFDYRFDHDTSDRPAARNQWVLSVPKAGVEGRLSIETSSSGKRRHLDFHGKGYHDHNLGAAPVYESIDRWYWGRAFSGRYDLVYYVMFLRDGNATPLAVMMLHDQERGTRKIYDRIDVSESRFRKGLFAPSHGEILRLQADTVTVEVRHRTALDSGPFYLRYQSSLTMDIEGERIDETRGISEFLDPEALQSKVMRFFTASRVWRDGEFSMMYTLYNFFKRQFDWFNRKKL